MKVLIIRWWLLSGAILTGLAARFRTWVLHAIIRLTTGSPRLRFGLLWMVMILLKCRIRVPLWILMTQIEVTMVIVSMKISGSVKMDTVWCTSRLFERWRAVVWWRPLV